MQTTPLEESAACLRLATMLVHASDEWDSSDWPVCAIGEPAKPRSRAG